MKIQQQEIKNMRKTWMFTAVGMCTALLLGACATKTPPQTLPQTEQTEEETAKQAAERAKQAKLDAIEPFAYGNVDGLDLEPGTYLSLIGKSSSGEYWEAVEKGAKAAVSDINKRLGYEGSDKVKVVYSAPAKDGNVDEQVNILDEELARYPEALGIAIIDSQSCTVQFDLAAQNGIPVVVFDSVTDYQGVMAKISTNNKAAAAEAAVRMAETVDEKGEVIIFASDSKSYTAKERVSSFEEEMKANHPGITVAGTYYMDQLDEIKKMIAEERMEADGNLSVATPEEKTALAEAITDEEAYDYILGKHPNAAGVYATNETAVMRMVETLERLEKTEVKLIGFDANSKEQKALKEGKITGLIVQNPYGMGYAAIVAEARSILEMGNEAEIDTGYIWVTAENIDEKEIQRML